MGREGRKGGRKGERESEEGERGRRSRSALDERRDEEKQAATKAKQSSSYSLLQPTRPIHTQEDPPKQPVQPSRVNRIRNGIQRFNQLSHVLQKPTNPKTKTKPQNQTGKSEIRDSRTKRRFLPSFVRFVSFSTRRELLRLTSFENTGASRSNGLSSL